MVDGACQLIIYQLGQRGGSQSIDTANILHEHTIAEFNKLGAIEGGSHQRPIDEYEHTVQSQVSVLAATATAVLAVKNVNRDCERQLARSK